ncbi:TPA: Expansin-B5 [Trebouxia sp. C0005]
MGQRDLARAALATTLAVAFAACPSTAQTIYNDTVVQFAAAEANGPANPSCGFGPLSLSSFPFGKAASINANSPFLEGLPQGGCGLCFQLTCEAGAICENSNQPLVVQLVDSGTSNISIRAQDFTALAPAYLGSIPVSVQQANCSIAGNIVIRILQYRAAGGGYIQLTFLNTIGGIDSVLLSASQANNFQPMYNQMAAVWVASNLPTPPLDVRIVSVTGQSVTAVGAITSIAQADIPTSVQFDATSQSSSASPAASGGVAVYTFPPSLPEATPTLPESPALTPPEPHATDGPPPSSPLPPLLNNTSPSPDSPTPSQAPAQETPTAAVVSAAAVAAAPSPGLAETLPAPTSFSEPAVAPSSSAVPAAPAPSKLLAAAPAASASSAAPTEPAASTATPLTNLAAAQLSVPAPTLIPGNSTITSSLESSSTADASLSLSSVTAAAQNLSAEPLVLTQDGVMYDLKGIASNGSCLTLWQLIQLSPNLTSWAYTIQAAGLVDAFNSSMQELTMFAPLNSAFQSLTVEVENALANLDGTLTTASQYLGSQPSLAQAIIGYQTVQSSHPLSLLRTQTQLNTSDILGANNASSYSLPLTIVVAGGNTAKVSGLQNSANVLQTDIPACGPSLLQLTDAVLLPVNPTDYVTSHVTPGNGSFTLAAMVAG